MDGHSCCDASGHLCADAQTACESEEQPVTSNMLGELLRDSFTGTDLKEDRRNTLQMATA